MRKPSAKQLMKYKFKAFLTDNDALKAFEKNVSLDQDNINKKINTLTPFLIHNDPTYFLLNAFTWGESPQSGRYWFGLDIKWQEIVRNERKESE